MKQALIAFALLAAPAAAAEDPHKLALAAGYKAAFLCSGRWNAGQDEASITRDDLTGIYREYQDSVNTLPATIDEAKRTVSVKFSDSLPPRVAAWRPLLGCAQLPPGGGEAALAALPRLVPGLEAPDLAATDAMPWPLGDAGAVQLLRKRKARAALDAVVGSAFADERTTAVIVLKDGKIIAERYRDGWSMHTPQRTWSVAKSLTTSLVGRAVQLGLVDVTKPAPVPQWQAPGDPRAGITWNHLLRMNSGLWTAGPGNRTDEVYVGGALVAQTAATMPLEHAPGSHFNYSNNDIMLAGLALSRTLAKDGGRHAALAFPFTELLWPLGMTRTTPETDWQGDFVLSSQVWMTARDLARLALLYQNGGKIGGQQLLPTDWPAFVEAATMTQPQGRPEGYGAGFWRWGGLGAHDAVPALPADTYAMNGNRGQYAVIVPGRNIIVIRRGFDLPAAPFPMPRFAAGVVATLDRITK
ncbi:serine hydrolase domain-containing protein [Sandarakinorhabdus limnophila]|uniref:serine hydrolase domain-containing protein n=1 Tax=Sandarakinorhabdus limnophila TaxID=210512 RepID=UPI0026EC1FD7|nr:serine hydrolase [Sandarakinorhabdus limnophila]MCM0031894.1 beta-lactamase family protein [Sandarakinorhabdus limnophila]